MRFFLAIFALIPLFAPGQGVASISGKPAKINYYVNLYAQADGSAGDTRNVLSFIDKLEQKKTSFKQTGDFLEYLFRKGHLRFLKTYAEYASFGETINKGRYNCLTGTAFYALLLDHFEIPYEIIETNYHIFLLAHSENGPVLFETTDPANGLVRNAAEIDKRVRGYKQNEIQTASSDKAYYKYNVDLYNQVNLDQLLGLLHYNLSIVAYNEQNLPLSIHHLSKAMESYQSPRFDEFSRIILLSVMEAKLEPSEKAKCLETVRSLRKKHLVVTASKN